MNSSMETERRIGLFGATGIGVGAIVGGGILALAGTALATTGPSTILAFGINGVIALLTALSFAEMASKFTESGGTYNFSKKVLSVETAFMVGWVVWFASIVAAVLYAVGFAHFAMVMTSDVLHLTMRDPPAWITSSRAITAVAVSTTLLLTIYLMRTAAGGGQLVNIGKVVVFGILIIGGLWMLPQQPPVETMGAFKPFLTAGVGGLLQAMGYTFIAFQGFDLIAAVGGEVREPSKTLPRAMIFSLAIALAIYLPLLFVITSLGTPPGQAINIEAAKHPESIIAIAAQRYLGPLGYWLVIVAAVLSMFSALQANLYAASRIARVMALDRTLPSFLGRVNAKRGTPVVAIVITSLLVGVLLLVVSDVGTAGAVSSLIFLISFALAHWISILVRVRSAKRPPPFRVPLFPAVPVVGGLACIGLAIFQGIAVPSAGFITVIWLGVGGILFLGLFARRARVADASSAAFDPELMTLRGRSPLVLVPVANPENAEAMITLADALVPAEIGRVLMQVVAVAPTTWHPDTDPAPIEKSQAVLRELLRMSAKTGIRIEMLTTVAPQPMKEIARVAHLHRCESVLLGLSEISENNHGQHLESLLGTLDTNVVVLRSRKDWQLAGVRKILIPIAGRGGHEHLRARLLGSLLRMIQREVTFLRVVPEDMKPDELRRAQRDLQRLANDEVRQRPHQTIVVQDADALAAVAARAEESDLLILGVQRIGRRKKLFGEFTRQIAQRTSCPMIVISRRG